MADEKKKEDQVATMRCNLTNNTPGRRVIYDGISKLDANGISQQKAITVESGETVYNVEVAKVIVEELRGQNNKKKDSVLVPSPPTEKPADEPVDQAPEPTAR